MIGIEEDNITRIEFNNLDVELFFTFWSNESKIKFDVLEINYLPNIQVNVTQSDYSVDGSVITWYDGIIINLNIQGGGWD